MPANYSNPQTTPARKLIYKTTGGKNLELHVFEPAGSVAGRTRPAILLFHGGRWRVGAPGSFYRQAEYLASRGMVVFCVQYRLIPAVARVTDCIDDARAAVRYVRAHATELGIDPGRIAAGGASAGGHLAAACAVLADPEHHAASARPDLLVLFCPALFHVLAEKTLSLADFSKGTPPAIFLLGDLDNMLDYAMKCLEKSKQAGNSMELYTAKGGNHTFLDHSPWLELTLAEIDRFLVRHQFLNGEPTIVCPPGQSMTRIE